MVLFSLPFWEFVCFCEALPDHWAQTVCCGGTLVCGYVCVYSMCVYVENIARQGEGENDHVKMWDAEMSEKRVIPLSVFVSEDSLNYNCIAAQSRDSSQAWAKPCWTRLNQAWTYSAQHALRFKPWLIGPKASKNPFAAVTGTGLGRDGVEREEESKGGDMQRDYFSILINLHEPSLDQYHFVFFPFLTVSPFFMHNLFVNSAGREPWALHLTGCCLWVKNNVQSLSTTRQSGN